MRATFTQTIFDQTARHNYKSAGEIVRATEFNAADAREFVTLAVGGIYLLVIASKE